MKAVWSGTISFGLVSIPVKLYSAISEQSLGFKMLCGKCHSPINYLRICPKCKKEVPWQNIEKGLKLATGKYFVATKEKIAKLRPEKSDTIDIVEFIDGVLIDPIYLKNHYYVGPTKKGEKPYFLLTKALQTTQKAAIGRFVMRDKEYVCALWPYHDGLLLSTLHYAYEIRPMDKVPYLDKVPKVSTSELRLAKQLISSLTKKKFDITKFKDTFAQQLKKAIKAGGKKIKLPETKKLKAPKDTTLLASLKASIAKPKARKTKARK